MQTTIIVELGNVPPMIEGIEIEEVIKVWDEAKEFFEVSPPSLTYSGSPNQQHKAWFDLSDIFEVLYAAQCEDEEVLERRFKQRRNAKLAPLGAQLIITFESVGEEIADERTVQSHLLMLLGRLLQLKSLFTVLRISEVDVTETEIILYIAQVLEAFFSEGKEGIAWVLKNRIHRVLGLPDTHKKWFNKFYDIRSRVAHGNLPMLRPGDFNWDTPDVLNYREAYLDPMDRAIGVLIAIIQDLVVSDARTYRFSEQFARE
ncbi:MAG: hypothetical protein U0641_08930 [Anaerolineae bacterium]